MALEYYYVLQLISAGVFFAAGVVALRAPSIKSKALGAFLIWFAIVPAFQTAIRDTAAPMPNGLFAFTLVLIVALGLTAARFVWITVRDHTAHLRTGFLAVAATVAVFLLVAALNFALSKPIPGDAFTVTQANVAILLQIILDTAFIGAIVLHPIIVRRIRDADEARSLAFVSTGFAALSMSAWSTVGSYQEASAWDGWTTAILSLPYLLQGALWFLPGNHRRIRQTTGAIMLGLALLGTALSYLPGPAGADAWVVAYGFGRIIAAGLLLAGGLLGTLPGIDRRIRFGISKTTVAALFVAVFFVVSEGAQQFFGERVGNQYYGIAAAGALVFAIAPIMRWTDGLAARAVPTNADGPSQFLRALRVVSADGRVSPEEELELARLADELGLGVAETARLRASFAPRG